MLQTRFFKISFVIALFILGPCACNPCGEVPRHFIVQSIGARNFAFSVTSSQAVEITQPNVVVEWDNYILDVPFNVEYTASIARSGSAAYATDCVQKGEGGANTGLKEIYVIAMKDYNELYHADDTLNSIVSVGENVNDVHSIEQFKSQNSPTLFAQDLIVKLTQAPADDMGFHQFKVVMHLLNGDIFSVTSDPVLLSK
jgi:hypothetical protein